MWGKAQTELLLYSTARSYLLKVKEKQIERRKFFFNVLYFSKCRKCHLPFEIFFLTSIPESYDCFIPSDSCSILLRPLLVHLPRSDHFYYTPLSVIITFVSASVTWAQAKTPLWRRRHGSGFSVCPICSRKSYKTVHIETLNTVFCVLSITNTVSL